MEETYLELEGDSFVLGIPLTKVDAKNRIVGGFATLDNVDKAGDILDAEASKRAFAKWAGNIREMHQKKAVGRKVNYEAKQYTDPESGETYDGIWVEAKISKGAEDTWQKVLDGTLSGFSVGGATHKKERQLKKVAGKDQEVWRITDYSLGELSLVDNPCNGLANVSLIKSMDGILEYQDELDDLEKDDKSVSASKEPYGDVHYADPGYQADGKKRYPIDTAEHARAAWDYINQTDDAHLYKPGDLVKVKSAIEKACKKFGVMTNTTEKVTEVSDLSKGNVIDPSSDDDAKYINEAVSALKAWQTSEVSDGDQGDIIVASQMLSSLKYRIQAGDGTDSKTILDQLNSGSDEDKAYIQKIWSALSDWQKYEVETEGDQSDIDLTSDLLQRLSWRIRCGDDPSTVLSDDDDDDMDKAIDAILDLYKDGDGDGDGDTTTSGGSGSTDDDDDSGPIIAYPAQHIEEAVKHIGRFRKKAKKAGHKNLVVGADHAIGTLHALHSASQDKEKMTKLHNNSGNDISVIDNFSGVEVGVLKKFLNFMAGKPAASQEAVLKESEDSEMDEKLIKEAVKTAAEDLVKSSDTKFELIGESLKGISDALEKVATTDVVAKLDTKIADALERINALETSGALKKSADDTGISDVEDEKIEKGFWSGNLVPASVQTRVKEGR